MNTFPNSIHIASFSQNIQILIQAPFQLEKLEKLGNGATFGIDSTHCTNRYGFSLTTLHLIEKSGGTPVACMISSDEKEKTIDVMTQFLAPKINFQKNINLISDDYPANINSWTKFGKGKPYKMSLAFKKELM